MGTISGWIDRLLTQIKSGKKTKSGQQAEALACAYLEARGLKLVVKNHRSKVGEIDLVMKTTEGLVFVEVRHRSREDWASAAESITVDKQKKIIRAAQHYCLQNSFQGHARFDVVAIDGDLKNPRIEWIEHAFY